MVIGSRQDAHGGWSECKQRPRNQSLANGSGGGSFCQPAIKTANGCRHIPQAQLNKFLEATKHSQTAARNTDRRRVSGSNQIIGRIIDIKTSGLVAPNLCIGCQRITSIVASMEVGLPGRLNA